MIVGAGLAGLIAAHAFPREQIFEAQPGPAQMHKALLRFRSPAVGDLCGIEFRPVEVHKGIWLDGGFVPPSIRAANLYSQKVIRHLMDRSIWNVEPCVRYVAPHDFYDRLVQGVGERIRWGVKVDFNMVTEPCISTAPLSIPLGQLDMGIGEEFRHKSIHVQRWAIEDCDVFQTVYFPSPEHSLYRASITGDLLVCEFDGCSEGPWNRELHAALGISYDRMNGIGTAEQNFGKIAPIDEGKRRAAIFELSNEHHIFSLGRFATWRNILLDDVVHDIAVVKRLMKAESYARRLASV